jgi:dolichol-phosphate mannosyltransferase
MEATINECQEAQSRSVFLKSAPLPTGYEDTPATEPRRLPAWLGLLGLVLVVHVAAALWIPVLPEEAYHWNFGKHLDWSYYDHPPLIAWSIALGCAIFGDTALGVRFVPILFLMGTIALMARFGRRLYGPRGANWAAYLYTLQPAAFVVGGWGFPDAPVLFFWTLTLFLVWRALEKNSPAGWMLAGAALGAGMLSKYITALLVPGVLLYLLFSRRDRRWLRTPWPFAAGVMSLVVFSPVLYWNWTHDWVSIRFQSVDRFEAATGFNYLDALKSIGEQWVAILPLTLPLAVYAVWTGWRSQRGDERLFFWTSVPMLTFFFVLGWTPSIHLLWPLPAYIGLTLIMAGMLARGDSAIARYYSARWRRVLVFEMLVVGVALVHAAFIIPCWKPLREMYGWDEAARAARVLARELPPDSFYIGMNARIYPAPSQLAFHLDLPERVYGQNLFDLESLQYRFWADPRTLTGKDAVIVVADGDPHGHVLRLAQASFRSVEPPREVEFPIGSFPYFEKRRVHFTFYLAHGYTPTGLLAAQLK